MATDARKHTVPGAADAPSRQALLDMSLSIRDLVPVATVTARAQLVADLTAIGQAPSATRPLMVYRADAAAGREVEVSVNGDNWRALNTPNDSGWINITPAAGFTTTDAQYRLKDGEVRVRGLIKRTAGVYPTSYTTVFTFPSASRPPVYGRFALGGYTSSNPNGLIANVRPTGELEIGGMGASLADAYLSPIRFEVD